MTKDDIIRMAREVGFAHSWSEAAVEALLHLAYSAGVTAEREECAKLMFEIGSAKLAAAIRERKLND